MKQLYCEADSITSGLLHLWGFLLAIGGTVLLILSAESSLAIVAACIYGASLICLFLASTVFHIFYISPKVHGILQKIDHSFVFCLIAGTYTPICLLVLDKVPGLILLVSIWSLALVGILGKVLWFRYAKWFSTVVYLAMGWGIVFFAGELLQVLPRAAIFWLAAGGICYSVGAVIYAARRLQFHFPAFGSHELFHLFVLAGAACHYYFMYQFVI
ncbi:hemolysin III family protein [Enterococcus sp. 669A]|uniref:Hemolysin III family protein n=1 Tax=Candidatus Enterococcus moelleringii TaxID=2815325 RepID=A0ABS3L909_9ENTE|nr:hemolysin III family protein [Enterococcus sp. 669A]MBO1306092.1 hemolysin III family protein [Enterococcus sp. 669A]